MQIDRSHHWCGVNELIRRMLYVDYDVNRNCNSNPWLLVCLIGDSNGGSHQNK